MALWCFDEVATKITGQVQFKRPHPCRDWLKDRDWNQHLIQAMYYIYEADQHFRKPATNWKDEDASFYREVITQCREQTII